MNTSFILVLNVTTRKFKLTHVAHILFLWNLAIQRVAYVPATSASAGSLLQVQNLWSHPNLLNQNLQFNKIPR